MTSTRELYWNIEWHWLMYPLMLLALSVSLYGFYKKYAGWRQGTKTPLSALGPRLMTVLMESLMQRRILRKPLSGAMHLALFWCFALSLFATAVIALYDHFNLPVFQGYFYLWLSLALDIFGGLALVATVYFLIRRFFFRPERLDNAQGDFTALVLLFLILFSGFVVEGLRIAGTGDPWADWSPLGYLVALLCNGLEAEQIRRTFQAFWWGHLLLAFGFIAYLPHGKLAHVLTGSLSQFLRDPEPSALAWLNLEDPHAEAFGVSSLSDYSSKDLLDTSSCTSCGRCQEVCPAYSVGKGLSPKKNVQGIKAQLEGRQKHTGIVAEDIWACTTCGACTEECPVFVRHGKIISGWRRNLVLTENSFPAEFQTLYRNLETNANPWGVGWAERGGWNDEMDEPVPVLGQSDKPQKFEYLYWVGCAGSFDTRNQKTVKAVCRLLQIAGVSFAILGNEEKCCGDPARRTGNEYIFQVLAAENAATFKRYGVKKIITACPHCFNTFAHEYAQLGIELTVEHHSQTLARLLEQADLKLDRVVAGSFAYHDPCYLGRYNAEYDAPRKILRSVIGAEVIELSGCKKSAFCCGAGGGHMWLEDRAGARINEKRARDVRASGAKCLAVGCPFCLTMLADGLDGIGTEEPKIADISEILLEAMTGGNDENSRAG